MHNILPSNVPSPVCTESDTHCRLHWLRSDHIFPWWARLWFSHDKYVSSEQWLDCARQVRDVSQEKSHFTVTLSDIRYHPGKTLWWGDEARVGSEHIWWWPHFTPPSRAGEFDALIGGCWYRGLVPYHEQMLHIFFRASNNTFAWYLVNHELHLANQLGRLSYKNPLHYDWVWAFVPRVESISHFKFVYFPIHYSCPQIETE